MIKGTLLCELWKLFEFKKDKANITTPIFIMKKKKKTFINKIYFNSKEKLASITEAIGRNPNIRLTLFPKIVDALTLIS